MVRRWFGDTHVLNHHNFTIMKKTLEIPLFTRAAITPNSYNEAEKTIEVVFATEYEVKRRSWDGTGYLEKLLCDPTNVRLDRLNAGAPLVDTHHTYTVQNIIGKVVRAWVEGKECKAIVQLSEREDIAGVVQDIRTGIISNISTGYNIHKYETEEDTDNNSITVRVTDWEPAELSVVPVPADFNAGTRSEKNELFKYQNINLNMPPIETAAPAATEEQRQAPVVTAPATPAAAATPVVDETKVRNEAILAERKRTSDIVEAVRKANITEEGFADELISQGKTLDEARLAILDKLTGDQPSPSRTAATLSTGMETIEKKRAAQMNALMHRVDPSIELKDEAKEFRGMSLLDMAREAILDAGGNVRGLSQMEIAKAALNIDGSNVTRMHSTSDFPVLLGNTVNAVLAREYKLRGRTFTEWAQRGSVKDFKEKSILSIGDFSSLEEVKEGGEYKYGTFGEGKEKMKVVKYGKKFLITWESIVNDDLDVFSRIPKMIVNAAIRKQSDLVYDILTGTHKMSDGVNIFHASHKNLATGSALDTTNIGLVRQLIRGQKSLDGKDFLDLTGKYLIVGPEQEEAALQYTASKFVPTEANKQNVWAGLFTPIIEPRITGKQWFIIADSAEIDTVEYAFLEGHPELFTEQRVGFDVDGLEIKARMVFGAKAVDYRGMAKNPGV